MEDYIPYIAYIVEAHQTRNGNYFCREVGRSLDSLPIDWPIFVSCDHEKKMQKLPIFGIVGMERHPEYFNNGVRPTCRLLSHDYKELENLLLIEIELKKEIERAIKNCS